MKSIEDCKYSFPTLSRKIAGKNLIYLDNAATSLKPFNVINAEKNYYMLNNSNIHRANHQLANESTQMYEGARKKVKEFINAKKISEIIFTKGATESLNLLAYSFAISNFFEKDEEILIPISEHHANFVPWQQISKLFNIKINYYVPEKGVFNEDNFLNLINKKTKLISFTGLSNVTGQIINIKKIVEKAKNINPEIITVVDGAQYVPHIPTDFQDLNVDFIVFSSHKMLGPMGVGVLYGKSEILEKMSPFLYGGEMIDYVTKENSTFNVLPYKFEAGTPNVAGVIAFAQAIEFLNELGMKEIYEHTKKLTKYALKKLSELDFVEIYGPKDDSHYSIISFNLKNIHPHDVSHMLNDLSGIAVRSGHHCAQLLLNNMNIKSSCRASFYFYNTVEDVEALIEGIKKVKEWIK
jgi:cysteine desulfurase/selenocysteine lyase